MNCCPQCFKDKEITGFIESNSTQNGKCDFCNTEHTSIIPASELYDTFQDLFLSYIVTENQDDEAAKYLFEHLKQWGIFLIEQETVLFELTKNIGSLLYIEQADLFTKKVVPRIFLESQYRQQANDYVETWTKLKEEIKNTNRFFLLNNFNFKDFQDILNPFEKTYKKGKLFYRARNSDIGGTEIHLMGKPPRKLASAGRANPQGISYLYLSNDVKTTLYEVRATLYDYVTVAEFEIIDEIKVASLRNIEKVSPFILENISLYLIYRNFLSVIESDLLKPLRRNDSELDYLPTQYLCEYIKSLNYDGVEYSSSLNPTGFNIALFDDKKLMCKSANVYEVNNINYDFDILHSME